MTKPRIADDFEFIGKKLRELRAENPTPKLAKVCLTCGGSGSVDAFGFGEIPCPICCERGS